MILYFFIRHNTIWVVCTQGFHVLHTFLQVLQFSLPRVIIKLEVTNVFLLLIDPKALAQQKSRKELTYEDI